MKKLDPGVAKRLLATEEGRMFAAFLAESILDIDTIRSITSEDPVQVAVEVKARKLTAEKLQEILSEMLFAGGATEKQLPNDDFKM